jgi:hypothetical protein
MIDEPATGPQGPPTAASIITGADRQVGDGQDQPRSEADAELEREIRKDRKFTLAEAIGRLGGPGALKGESPVSRRQQAEAEIQTWLGAHLTDSEGALQVVLLRAVSRSETFLHNFERPLFALREYIGQVLDSEQLLKDLVHATDMEWGRLSGERPRFDPESGAPRLDDPYTAGSVRGDLSGLVKLLTTTE